MYMRIWCLYLISIIKLYKLWIDNLHISYGPFCSIQFIQIMVIIFHLQSIAIVSRCEITFSELRKTNYLIIITLGEDYHQWYINMTLQKSSMQNFRYIPIIIRRRSS